MKSRGRFVLLVGVLVFAAMLVPSLAFANFGPHGGFSADTDQCAGCHRAHTAPSAATWAYNDAGTLYTGSALLLGVGGTTVPDFCLTCHGPGTQGADTNVIDGIYMVRQSGGAFGTPGAALISGPFGDPDRTTDTPFGPRPTASLPGGDAAVTSWHGYGSNPQDLSGWGAWGGGTAGQYAWDPADNSAPYTINAANVWTGNWSVASGEYRGTGSQRIPMDCATCHDSHGTSNYRMLKDQVFGVMVGGYATDGSPAAWVESAEFGFPDNGFERGVPTPAGYHPNYTTPRYAKPRGGDQRKGMSGWCVGCHTVYMGMGATITAGAPGNISRSSVYAAENAWGDVPAALAVSYGNIVRHRHPVNVPTSNFHGPTDVVFNNLLDNAGSDIVGTPLANDIAEKSAPWNQALTKSDTDWVDCLSCHYAHGTTATMSGYSNVGNSVNPIEDSGNGGVQPTEDSALLRANNRAVCQACHNK